MRVLHYTERWLELSQGFVHAYVAGSRHGGAVVSRRSLENRAAFPFRPVWSLNALERVGTSFGYRTRSLALEALARIHRADAVHVHLGYVAPDVVGLIRRRDLPLVVSFHGHDVTAVARQTPGFYDAVVPLTACAIVPSTWLGDRVVGLGFDPARVAVVPSGVDTTFFAPTPIPAGDPVVAFVGRLVPKKGIDVLLDAWPTVRAAVPGAVLHVVGDGPLGDRVAGAAGPGLRWSLPDAADRHGQVRSLLRSATVVATPSHTAPDGDAESLLLVNLEAAASGRAVVTTRHGGIPEYVKEGHTALVVPEGDSAALADALVAALREPSLAARLGAAGVSWAAQFDVVACTTRRDDLVSLAPQRIPTGGLPAAGQP
jgi:colanic acid/amylovoran biosynthesis glycosyltransferase